MLKVEWLGIVLNSLKEHIKPSCTPECKYGAVFVWDWKKNTKAVVLATCTVHPTTIQSIIVGNQNAITYPVPRWSNIVGLSDILLFHQVRNKSSEVTCEDLG